MSENHNRGRATALDEIERARLQIEHTREELAKTVHALAEKTDVKAQLHHKVDTARHEMAARTEALKAGGVSGAASRARQLAAQARAKPKLLIAVAVVVGLMVVRIAKRD